MSGTLDFCRILHLDISLVARQEVVGNIKSVMEQLKFKITARKLSELLSGLFELMSNVKSEKKTIRKIIGEAEFFALNRKDFSRSGEF